MDIEAQIRKLGLKSALNVGRLIHKDLGDGDWPSEASLGTYVLKLAKGEKSWWLRGEAARARLAIARILKMSVAELFPELQGANPFDVTSWPTLRAFDPARDKLCEAGVVVEAALHVGLGNIHTPAYGSAPRLPPGLSEYVMDRKASLPRWVLVPPGGGKSFVTALARHRGMATVDVLHLREVVELPAEGAPLVIRVGAPSETTDLQAVQRLGQHTHVTVLAEFSRPRRPAGIDSSGRLVERKAPGDMQWQDAFYCGDPDLRDGFVRDVGDRAGWAAEDTGRVVAWLTELDPSARVVGTPGALLWIAGRIDELGLRSCQAKGLPGLFGLYLDMSAQAIESSLPDVAAWLRANGERIYLGILSGRAADQGQRGWRAAPIEAWERLTPKQVAVLADVAERLAALAQEGDADRRLALAAMLAGEMVAAKSEQEIVGRLRQARLLVPVGNGVLAAEPAWFVQSWIQKWLEDEIASKGLRWGRLCFDVERRDDIDRAMDRVVQQPAAFSGLLARVNSARLDVDGVGAVEAVFAAVGRALVQDWRPTVEVEDLHKLWKQQLRCAVSRYTGSHPPVPASRRGSSDVWLDVPRWFESCWSWSFALARPAETVPQPFRFLFPGWCDVTVAELPRDLGLHAHQGGLLFSYLVRMCEAQADATPANDAAFEVWTAWVLARILDGRPQGAAKGKLVNWDLLSALATQAHTNSGGLDRQLSLAVMRAALELGEPSWLKMQLFGQDAKAELRKILISIVDDELCILVLDSCEAGPSDIFNWILPALPQHVHLAAVKWAVAREPASTRMLSAPIDRLAQTISLDALRWLAKEQAGDWWPLVRTWATRDQEGALAWLLETTCAHPNSHAALFALDKPRQDRFLEWLESLPAGERPENAKLWPTVVIESRPDLAERLLPLLPRPILD